MLDHVLTVYCYGYDINSIAYDVDKSEEEVLKMLQQFKKENTVSGRHYSDGLRSLIIDRFKNGVTPFIIEKELGMGKGVAKRLIQKEGYEIPKTSGGRRSIKAYTVIQHDNFLKCPDCGSERVNDLNNCYWDEELDAEGSCGKGNKKTKPHSYCVDCGTEWYKEGSKVRKVLFHELDEDQEC
ncbi:MULTISPECIES: hypothetical protein [Bacillus]|uniref:hypothetical protein n=1 Tax=Bacillus TaxID=1386 RepID=UPI0009B7A18F|nr:MULTISPECIES: hypothetical protein [Bacillus]ARC72606.1 hypothetical protein B37_00553 [Bacillus licheniformis]ARW56591.1 hypothetical protein S100027_04627 [Bacillus licheniformis]AXF87860.1 hypothetical protein BLDA23_06045 [Bacillus licheniformis]KAA6475818.1 hypothetical protein DX928_06850 [Bacillus swezeyi]